MPIGQLAELANMLGYMRLRQLHLSRTGELENSKLFAKVARSGKPFTVCANWPIG